MLSSDRNRQNSARAARCTPLTGRSYCSAGKFRIHNYRFFEIFSIDPSDNYLQRTAVVLASLRSAAVLGVEALPVIVEVDVSFGLPVFTMVGLPDASVRESRDRVRTAIRNSGFEFPGHRITVNLAPADIRKAGASYDLPIALGVLAASGVIEPRLRRRGRPARRAVARRSDSADSRRAAGCRGRKARGQDGDSPAARERARGLRRRRAEGAAG